MSDLPAVTPSPIRRLNAGGLVEQNWRQGEELRAVVERQRAELASLRTYVQSLRGKLSEIGFGMHPFRIYQFPASLRTTQDANTDWRKFRVRHGRIITSTALGFTVNGTDGETRPDLDTYPNVPDITVPIGIATYWFWLEIAGTVATLRHGENPATNGWTSFPTIDDSHIAIGYVDTATSQSEKRAIVRQLLRTDVASGGGGGTGSPAEPFRIVTMFADCYQCVRIADGSTQYVAKPTKLRNAIGSEVIDGLAVAYIYDLNYVARTAAFSGTTEVQVIVPHFLTDDIVWAIPVSPPLNLLSSPGVIVSAGFLDQNIDARAWATTQI